jgi:photosystem II stability/assembly factor-like uncharacterized protein
VRAALTPVATALALAVAGASALPSTASAADVPTTSASTGSSATGPGAGTAATRESVRWVDVGTGTDEQYRALDAVNRRVAWVAGEAGGVLLTRDGGRTWKDVAPPRSDGLVFRDIEARGSQRASVLAIGEGTASRIYTTRNGGRTWTTAFVNRAPKAFYNCMAFWPGGRQGIAVSDPVQGKFRILRTSDGGSSWRVVPPRGMPRAVDGEYNFAASGTCLVTTGKRRAAMASGGAAARIFGTTDRGRTWKAVGAPQPAAEAGGVFSLAFSSARRGIAVGGDFTAPDDRAVTGTTRTGGRAWRTTGRTHGYRSGVDYRAGHPRVVIAVGPSGTDLSRNGGRTWRLVDTTPLDGVQCARDGSCWGSGPDGAVVRLRWKALRR